MSLNQNPKHNLHLPPACNQYEQALLLCSARTTLRLHKHENKTGLEVWGEREGWGRAGRLKRGVTRQSSSCEFPYFQAVCRLFSFIIHEPKAFLTYKRQRKTVKALQGDPGCSASIFDFSHLTFATFHPFSPHDTLFFRDILRPTSKHTFSTSTSSFTSSCTSTFTSRYLQLSTHSRVGNTLTQENRT